MIDINTSKINRIIIHRVFSIKDKNTREINELTELEPNIINFGDNEILMLKNRISKSFSKGSKFFKLQIEESGMGSFFSLASECQKCDDDNFIKKSNRIASLLAEGHLQRAAIPGGLLLILDGFDENNNYFLMVIKAEPQDAFTLNEHKIEIVKNLFLSPAKEFFKIGLIIDDNTSKSKNINKKFSSWVYDDQFQPTRIDLAVYFYKTFLGFSTSENDKILTNNFIRDFKNYVDTEIEGFDNQKGLREAINSYYRENVTGIIEPTTFIESIFEGDDLEKFNHRFLHKYPHSFSKDLTLIDNKSLFRDKLKIAPHLELVGSSEIINNRIDVYSKSDLNGFNLSVEKGDIEKIIVLKTINSNS